MHVSRSLIFAGLLLIPLQAAMAQSSGSGAGGGSAGGAASGAGASPSAGGANPGVVGDSLNRSNPNPTLNQGGSGTSAQPAVPGTNSAGTAQSSGSSAGGGSAAANGNNSLTTGSAGSRAGGRVDGVDAQGPNKTGDPIRAEDPTLDKKIKSICRGC